MTIIAVNIFFKTLHINSRDKYTKNSPWIRKITIKLLDSIYLTQDSQFDLDASPSFGATHHTACLVPCKAYLGNTNGTFEKKTLGFFRPDTLRIPGGKLKGFFRDFLCKNPGRGGGPHPTYIQVPVCRKKCRKVFFVKTLRLKRIARISDLWKSEARTCLVSSQLVFEVILL